MKIFAPPNDNQIYVQSYHAGYAKTQRQKGWRRGYNAAKRKARRYTKFSGVNDDPDFIEGYCEGYDVTMRCQREENSAPLEVSNDFLKVDPAEKLAYTSLLVDDESLRFDSETIVDNHFLPSIESMMGSYSEVSNSGYEGYSLKNTIC